MKFCCHNILQIHESKSYINRLFIRDSWIKYSATFEYFEMNFLGCAIRAISILSRYFGTCIARQSVDPNLIREFLLVTGS